MERNKVLMVVVSVTFFLAAVVGVGVALLYPRNEAAATGSAIATTQSFDPIEYLRRPDPAALARDDAAAEPAPMIVYGQPETTAPVAVPEVLTAPAPGTTPGVTQRPATIADTTGRTQERPAAVQPTITATPAAPAAPRVTAPAPAPAPATSAPAPTVSAAPPAVAPAAPRTSAPTGTTTRTAEPARVTEYWIQLIASPSFDRVEQARARLTEYSLGARVTTRDVNGTLFYRLRVGPYLTREEADKFLEWLRRIDGFEAAYISEEYPVRTASR